MPVPPAEVNRAVPALSEIIMHLLEKRRHRYQTAEGVVADLERLRDAARRAAPVRVGEHDVPLRLVPRRGWWARHEVAALAAAFEEALAGRCRGVLVGGVPGVGKTALVDELRPVVTGSDGWFVAGKFDQYRRDLEFDAVIRRFAPWVGCCWPSRRMSWPGSAERILRAVGANAGLLTAWCRSSRRCWRCRPIRGIR